MSKKIKETSSLGSVAEDRFFEIFCDTFGPENSKYFSVQHPVLDIYGRRRFIDFAIESRTDKIAIEIDGETYHNPRLVSENKYIDDMEKQNSLIYGGWKVYRWTYREIESNRNKVKDELTLFIGELPEFRSIIADDINILELKGHQEEALESLSRLRKEGKNITLLHHATGTGKTVTAISDARRLGYKTLFLAHRKEIVLQAKEEFERFWEGVDVGLWMGGVKEDAHVICGSIQSIYNDLHKFSEDEFGYIIIDEAHHAPAETYADVIRYFKPVFTLGLTATVDRMDGKSLLDIFESVGHRLDLRTAVERGELVPVRCIRVNTNIDISDVRINGIKYNTRDLESKIFIPDRNKLIVDTYKKFVSDKKTVIFCASVKHSEEVAQLLEEEGINARSVSGAMNDRERLKVLEGYENGDIEVLCACDLLNEGWDSPITEVLFMARPTLSKSLYIQQLGRGLRLNEGKEYLMVFDFIDNANVFNTPYSLHRVLNISKYIEGGLVLAPKRAMHLEEDLIYRGEKPDIVIDYPVRAMDYELIELFDWQEEVEDMVSQLEFVRMVDVQSETIARYVREEKIHPDLTIPMGRKKFHYFKKDKVKNYAKEFNWDLITKDNITEKFLDYVDKMDMSYSYKPVFLKAFIANMDEFGKSDIEKITDYFIDFYESRRDQGLVVETKRCLYTRELKDGDKERYSRKEVTRNILSNPFKRFEDMNFMQYHREIKFISLNKYIFKELAPDDYSRILDHCDLKLNEYYDE